MSREALSRAAEAEGLPVMHVAPERAASEAVVAAVARALIEGGRHRLRPILMTAFATMLALAPLAVTGGGGGVGGAFISGPLAIVVIGGLFTSTLLTLILVPVLYSLTARFTARRTTRDLDAVLDAAEDRRFKPLGLDRKSTRLNSSHSQISYAVFCLKKKKS